MYMRSYRRQLWCTLQLLATVFLDRVSPWAWNVLSSWLAKSPGFILSLSPQYWGYKCMLPYLALKNK